MPSYHLSQKIGHAGKAAAHAAYIARLGDYAAGGSKGKDLQDLEAVGSGNMPAWAQVNPEHFWRAADLYEVATGASIRPLCDEKGKALCASDGHVLKVLQKNRGQAYKEIEVALPRELDAAQRLALVHELIEREIGKQHAYTFAIHVPKAKIDGGDQPHLHLMYSERMTDLFMRDPEQYFRRYRPKNPDKGGCQKASSGKSAQQNKEELVARRERWALLQNRHLQAAGFHDEVDHRSNAERRIPEVPERHLGARALERQREEIRVQRALKALARAARAELREAENELEQELWAEAEANLILLDQEIEADEEALAQAQARMIVLEQEQAAATQQRQGAIELGFEEEVARQRMLAAAVSSEAMPGRQHQDGYQNEYPNQSYGEDENAEQEWEEDQDDPAPAPGM